MVVPSRWPCPIDDIVIWSFAFDDGEDVVEGAIQMLPTPGWYQREIDAELS